MPWHRIECSVRQESVSLLRSPATRMRRTSSLSAIPMPYRWSRSPLTWLFLSIVLSLYRTHTACFARLSACLFPRVGNFRQPTNSCGHHGQPAPVHRCPVTFHSFRVIRGSSRPFAFKRAPISYRSQDSAGNASELQVFDHPTKAAAQPPPLGALTSCRPSRPTGAAALHHAAAPRSPKDKRCGFALQAMAGQRPALPDFPLRPRRASETPPTPPASPTHPRHPSRA